MFNLLFFIFILFFSYLVSICGLLDGHSDLSRLLDGCEGEQFGRIRFLEDGGVLKGRRLLLTLRTGKIRS